MTQRITLAVKLGHAANSGANSSHFFALLGWWWGQLLLAGKCDIFRRLICIMIHVSGLGINPARLKCKKVTTHLISPLTVNLTLCCEFVLYSKLTNAAN